MTERKKQDRWSLTDLIGMRTDELIQEIKQLESYESSEAHADKVLFFILENVCKRYFTTIKQLRSKCRDADLINARYEYIYLCETYPVELSPVDIMRKLNRSRSNFYNGLYMFKNYLFANDPTTKGFRRFQLDLYKRISRRDFEIWKKWK